MLAESRQPIESTNSRLPTPPSLEVPEYLQRITHVVVKLINSDKTPSRLIKVIGPGKDTHYWQDRATIAEERVKKLETALLETRSALGYQNSLLQDRVNNLEKADPTAVDFLTQKKRISALEQIIFGLRITLCKASGIDSQQQVWPSDPKTHSRAVEAAGFIE